MLLSIRPTFLLCSFAIVLSCPDLARGQFNRQQFPARSWATTPPSAPDRMSQGVNDFSSMSPDSWSAPISDMPPPRVIGGTFPQTPETLPPRSGIIVTGPSNIVTGPSNIVTGPSNQFALPGSVAGRSGNQFDPSFRYRPVPPTVQNFSPLDFPVPSVPELRADIERPNWSFEPGEQQRALANQQEEAPGFPLLPGTTIEPQRAPFRASKFGLPEDGPTLNGPKSGSQNREGEFNFNPPGVAPGNDIPGVPTGPTTMPFPSNQNPLPLPQSVPPNPNLVPGGIPSPSQQTAPGGPVVTDRYPLGINQGGFPQPRAIEAVPRAGLPGTVPGNPNDAVGRYWGSGLPSRTGVDQIFQPVQPPFAGIAPYRPDLGHRMPGPTFRGRDYDSGQQFDFENKKKDYPGIGEILATGRYFGSASLLFLQPGFQQNSGITQFDSAVATATTAQTETIDFGYQTAPRFRLGFESRFGPGVELNYQQLDQRSNTLTFTSNGTTTGQLFGPVSSQPFLASNLGETVSVSHGIDIETFSAMFFKEIKFPISRLNGMFGFQYASVFQSLDAELTDGGGAVLRELRSTTDLRAYGPRFRFEYYRPVGHTKLEFVTAFGGSVLFGDRDQIVTDSQSLDTNRIAADEFVLTGEFYGGVQFKKLVAENRGFYGRVGFTYESWVGGGNAISGENDFGTRGFALEVGYNR